ncbi:RagB/SusD family nutrient uptake outer membrane protein [Robertkochia marina]|uniref:RagB/SusD family nutrient uptake outer membrane protein n=1 Tax=Robertkochia marina TaxID=1227945 RepID=A0A4S3M1F9_9FLAO|nr:RagB/SusD family nutrient uptake outer membrane protein [Robertkochia marina]THD66813.1 RagB/SusD family nutrient uptake outer membrane protein [Robertkochia marina]TRZ40880.1 RagB/SusD family nutrient uptake outer membrane protein [Robertkochia marina]
MKTLKTIVYCSFLITCFACSDSLDLEPTDKITANDLFADPAGTQLYLADLYDRLPIEDLTYFPKEGFNYNQGGPNNGGFNNAMLTSLAHHSERNSFINDSYLNWWDPAFRLIRDVNLFIEIIPTLNISEDQKALYRGEAAFIRAFTYFGLAKRYGGVPILLEAQEYDGDPSSLIVPRNTEVQTWDFILEESDVAINSLGNSNGRRASKWAALALKSRAALHAASIAKFGDNVDLTGDAVNQNLVGIPAGEANRYYQACIDASAELMDNGPYSLYKPNPASAEEAATNFRAMFANPNIAPEEAILIKGRTIPGDSYGNNYDIWFNPAQTRNGWPHPGRFCPTLEFVDLFESYSNPGQDAPIITTVDGNVDNYNGFDASREYIHYSDPEALFADKDARLRATVILPFSDWKGVKIIYQAGYIQPDGVARVETNASIDVNGTTYYTYGTDNPETHSGFNPYGGNMTKTGFGFKKLLSNDPVIPGWNRGTTDFAEFRFAEVLLNYAEAVVESGLGDAAKATEALNATRKRAFHQTDIPLTVENVMRERTVELAFENKRIWDLMRRRSYHTTFNNTRKHALFPVLDLRGDGPYEYIFLRNRIRGNDPQTFDVTNYYRKIPGTGLNGLIQNP